MKKERAGEDSSIIDMLSGYIKVFSISELKTRFLGRARDENWGLVVFENGIVKEIVI